MDDYVPKGECELRHEEVNRRLEALEEERKEVRHLIFAGFIMVILVQVITKLF